MAASPSYGEQPAFQGSRRSFHAPARSLSLHERAGLDESDAAAEVLYSHPNARVIRFRPPEESIVSEKKHEPTYDVDYPVDTVETLPWRSRTEVLLATGPMVIEKVKGSTIFLKCQEVVKAMMKNSQCWCVDGKSKFVFRIKAFEYYRVELPCTTEEDQAKVDELKTVLPTVQRYERTPCPFIRAFSVELPGDAITPRRRGTWKRRDSSQHGLSDAETTPGGSLTNGARSSRRAPPNSYPRNAPVFSSPLSAGRPGSAASFEDRGWSSFTPRQRNGGHDSDEESELTNEDRNNSDAEEASLESRGRTFAPRNVSAPVPVSVRIASIERSKRLPIQPGPISRRVPSLNTDLKKPLVVAEKLERTVSINGHEPSLADKPQEETNVPQENMVSSDDEIHPPLSSPPSSSEAEPEFVVKVTDPQDDVLGVPEPTSIDTKSVQPQDDTALLSSSISLPEAEPVADERPAPVDEASKETSSLHDTSSDLMSTGETDATISSTALPTQENAPNEIDKQLLHTNPTGDEIEPVDLKELSPAQGEPTVSLPEPTSDVSEVVNANGDEQAISPAASTEPVDEVSTHDDEVDGHQETNIDSIENELVDEAGIDIDDAVSVASSADSFHTIPSLGHDGSTSETSLDFGEASTGTLTESSLRPASNHQRTISELTVTDNWVGDTGMTSGMSTPTTQDINSGLRQRQQARRSFSPMPPASTIITGAQLRNPHQHRELAKAILQTVVVIPLEAAVFMMHVLSRIVHGATPSDLFSGELFRRPEHRRRVSGFADQLHENNVVDHDEAQEDDYGVPLRGRRRTSSRPEPMIDENDEREHELEHEQH